MYDMLMLMLEERGIHNSFCDELSQFSTEYEHKIYIEMIESLQKYLKK